MCVLVLAPVVGAYLVVNWLYRSLVLFCSSCFFFLTVFLSLLLFPAPMPDYDDVRGVVNKFNNFIRHGISPFQHKIMKRKWFQALPTTSSSAVDPFPFVSCG